MLGCAANKAGIAFLQQSYRFVGGNRTRHRNGIARVDFRFGGSRRVVFGQDRLNSRTNIGPKSRMTVAAAQRANYFA